MRLVVRRPVACTLVVLATIVARLPAQDVAAPATPAGPERALVDPATAPERLGERERAVAERRARILEVARRYATHRWTADARNVLHGEDQDGVLVHTPDVGYREDGYATDGSENVGVPYKWGGFSSLAEFDAAVAAGRPAGELTDGIDLDSSRFTVGVDCSGFVARCWDLPFKQSTRSLGRLCFELASYDELLPGDLINKFDAHAMVFVGFADDERARVRVVEATLPRVKESVYEAARLAAAGYRPYRYKPLDPRWTDTAALAGDGLALPSGGTFEPTGEAASGVDALDGLPDPLRDARVGDEARLRVVADGGELLVVRRLARRDTATLVVQSETRADGGVLETLEEQPLRAAVLERLLALRDEGQPYDRLDLVGARVTPGRFAAGGFACDATRVELVLDGSLTARSQSLPVTLRLDAVLGAGLPLDGVLSLRREVVYGLPSGPARSTSLTELAAFARGRADG